MPQTDSLRAGEALLSRYEPPAALPPLSLEITVIANEKGAVAIALRVASGGKRFVVRNVAKFVRGVIEGRTQDFSRLFSIQGNIDRFSSPERMLIRRLTDVCDALEGRGEALSSCRALSIPRPFVPSVMRPLCALEYILEHNHMQIPQTGVAMSAPQMRIICDMRGQTLRLKVHSPELNKLDDAGEFWLCGNRIHRLSAAASLSLTPLFEQIAHGAHEFTFPPRSASRAISELLPAIESILKVEYAPELNSRLIRAPLKAAVYLDRATEGIAARVEFDYNNITIDPFSAHSPGEDSSYVVRDAQTERGIIDIFSRYGFTVRPGGLTLRGQDEIYAFLKRGLPSLEPNCAIYYSKDFEGIRPRQLHFNARARLSGGEMLINFYDDDQPIPHEDILSILAALEQQRRYIRLSGGRFLTLSDDDFLLNIAGHYREAGQFDADGTLHMPERCALYMADALAENIADDALRRYLAAPFGDMTVEPVELNATLRHYQTEGYEWLSVLHKARLGGILADDMGLGKTLQAIALLSSIYKIEGARPSLIIVPSTLLYNWLSEIHRFAPELRATAIVGTRAKREQIFAHFRETADIALTTYPLLRRDGDLLSSIEWETVILDEAQHIKNAQSIAAINAKLCVSRSRFALTGTPLENHPDDLHSLFSFVLSGFLPPIAAFNRQIAREGSLDALRRRMRLFLMRRLKSDVLKELPGKIEQRVLIPPTNEQKRIYSAVQSKLRKDIREMLKERGFDRGRMEVLSAITQLRQICCHPRICLAGYAGGSGKLDMLLETLPDMISSGHRALIFSQFVSMLHILRESLTAAGVKCLYLDGSTPVRERLPLCESFNDGEGDVFLISLKAGGSGLNLTGADVVIHYDPWWNPAVEDQATDRAHRINQTKSVQVIKLILAGSIEESVMSLSQRKRSMFDALITPGGTLPSRMTPEELLNLLEPSPTETYL